jgi:Mor family transcriptional regulator
MTFPINAQLPSHSGATKHKVERNREMYELYKKGWRLYQLAEKYGISRVTIGRIIRKAARQEVGEYLTKREKQAIKGENR